ncbi:uncharacterized protein LACBIDRAFT_309304 [Laccaria bicolor S238N-H82]|uniref:Predicted protein n=1 Tax=Laccaria bicolor (strain S238N-H82 / ATCC MYA-4686) TaxID=486041 RepID=B0CW22_LACBS|nr:uncharacterized protein LACBIDRAFT_309304 [Laccaria bicolor S238N-H82]EDR13435.1 predicted protein [Laccaria bicolor S238N-H82]|eukprot:XP_001875933.1 predicted protein [Laccaria bicolor S238N-H82]
MTMKRASQAADYRQLLIQSIHVMAIKSSEVVASVVHALMDFLGDSNNPRRLSGNSLVFDQFEPNFSRSRLTRTPTNASCMSCIQILSELLSTKMLGAQEA